MADSPTESSFGPIDIVWGDSGSYGDFELVHSGSYADVYRAKRAGRYFLLKALHGGDPSHLAMLKREYEISVGLDHPNIAGTFTFEYETEVGPCIVMNYVDGKPLNEYLQGRPSRKVRKKLVSQLLEAVAYIHSKGVIHNDLKPENIMVTNKGEDLKLIDFGLSDDDAHYLITTPGCTAMYASPELAGKTGNVDQRSDIYSLGIIISLICPGRYGRIASKCRREHPDRRYGSVEAIIRAVRRADTSGWAIPVAALLVIALSAILIPAAIRARGEMAYRDLVKSADSRFNELQNQAECYIRQAPLREFGLQEIAAFAQSFDSKRDSCLATIENNSFKERFNVHCDAVYDKCMDSLIDITDSLPDMSGLSYDELEYYCTLLSSGERYRPYEASK